MLATRHLAFMAQTSLPAIPLCSVVSLTPGCVVCTALHMVTSTSTGLLCSLLFMRTVCCCNSFYSASASAGSGLLDDAYHLSYVRQLNITIFLDLVKALGTRARPELPPWSIALGWLQRMTDVLSTASLLGRNGQGERWKDCMSDLTKFVTRQVTEPFIKNVDVPGQDEPGLTFQVLLVAAGLNDACGAWVCSVFGMKPELGKHTGLDHQRRSCQEVAAMHTHAFHQCLSCSWCQPDFCPADVAAACATCVCVCASADIRQ